MLNIDPALFRPDAVSAETAAFNDKLEAMLAEAPAIHEVDPVELRTARDEGRGLLPADGPRDGSDWREAPTPMGRVRLTMPKGDPTGVYIHIHGGGWTMGGAHLSDIRCQNIAEAAGCVVVSLPYRFGPENRWPACGDDVEAGTLWALDVARSEFGTDRVAIGGESAGGHLAAVTLLRLKAAGRLDEICGAVLNYGVFDLALSPSAANWGERKMILSTPTIAWFVENLTGGAADLNDPAINSIRADLSGMPPALFQCGTVDPLIDDTLQMAARWIGAGSEAELAIFPGGVHAFDLFDMQIAREARARVAGFVSKCFGASA